MIFVFYSKIKGKLMLMKSMAHSNDMVSCIVVFIAIIKRTIIKLMITVLI